MAAGGAARLTAPFRILRAAQPVLRSLVKAEGEAGVRRRAVGESVEMPLEYYENNLGTTFSLVRAMRRHGAAMRLSIRATMPNF